MALGFTSYSVDNDRIFREAIERAKGAVSDLTVPLRQISADFYKSEKAIFNLKSPGAYPDLSDRYKKEKQAAVGFLYPILKRSGALADSVLGPNNPGSINEIINKDTLIIGTSIPYGVKHQEGLGVPMRKFLFIGPEAVQFAIDETKGRAERWLNILNSYVLAKLGAPQ